MLSGWLAVGAIVLLVGFLAVVLWAMNSRWLADRGWVFNRHNRHLRRSVGSLGLLETIYQPSMEHVIEERSSEAARGEAEESGDKPESGR